MFSNSKVIQIGDELVVSFHTQPVGPDDGGDEFSVSCVQDFASCNNRCNVNYGYDPDKLEPCKVAVAEHFLQSQSIFKRLTCFSADEWVEVLDTRENRYYCTRLRHLREHQLVRTSYRTFEPVLSFLHKDLDVETVFYDVHFLVPTRGAERLRLTPEHLVFVRTPGSTSSHPTAKRAEHLRPGDEVLVNVRLNSTASMAESAREFVFALTPQELHPLDRTIGSEPILVVAAPIVLVEAVIARGIVAPLTYSGRVVVNDVHCSCYAHVPNHHYAHFWSLPVRMFLMTRYLLVCTGAPQRGADRCPPPAVVDELAAAGRTSSAASSSTRSSGGGENGDKEDRFSGFFPVLRAANESQRRRSTHAVDHASSEESGRIGGGLGESRSYSDSSAPQLDNGIDGTENNLGAAQLQSLRSSTPDCSRSSRCFCGADRQEHTAVEASSAFDAVRGFGAAAAEYFFPGFADAAENAATTSWSDVRGNLVALMDAAGSLGTSSLEEFATLTDACCVDLRGKQRRRGHFYSTAQNKAPAPVVRTTTAYAFGDSCQEQRGHHREATENCERNCDER